MRSRLWARVWGAALAATACGTVGTEVPVESRQAEALIVAAVRAHRGTPEAPKLVELRSFPDASGALALHIARIAGGGFVVLSADRRLPPVLAWSDDRDFPMGAEVEGPSGLDDWLGQHVRAIERLRGGHAAVEPEVALGWQQLERGAWPVAHAEASASPLNGALSVSAIVQTCTPSYVSVSPLLGTTWGQTCGYALSTPALGCSGGCGRAVTGCVATATAQVMKYFQHPPSFNWAAMTPFAPCLSTCSSPSQWPASSQAISTLLADVGRAVGMSYGCSSSSARTARDALTQRYGYSATEASYDSSRVRSEILSSRPVLLTGFSKDCFLFVCWPGDGHMWVADGLISSTTCDSSGNAYGAEYLHMNWGWDGYYDGYYLNFAPAGRDYTHYNKMITARPNPSSTPPPPPQQGSCPTGYVDCGGTCTRALFGCP